MVFSKPTDRANLRKPGIHIAFPVRAGQCQETVIIRVKNIRVPNLHITTNFLILEVETNEEMQALVKARKQLKQMIKLNKNGVK